MKAEADRDVPVLTPVQIRMAKAALGWSNPMLAETTGLHRNTLNRAENGDAKRPTLELLKRVFEEAGLEFIPENGGGAGIRFRERSGAARPDESIRPDQLTTENDK